MFKSILVGFTLGVVFWIGLNFYTGHLKIIPAQTCHQYWLVATLADGEMVEVAHMRETVCDGGLEIRKKELETSGFDGFNRIKNMELTVPPGTKISKLEEIVLGDGAIPTYLDKKESQ